MPSRLRRYIALGLFDSYFVSSKLAMSPEKGGCFPFSQSAVKGGGETNEMWKTPSDGDTRKWTKMRKYMMS